jgi:hypothetical protein
MELQKHPDCNPNIYSAVLRIVSVYKITGCFQMTKDEKKYGSHHLVKIGTLPGSAAWVRFPQGGAKVGATLEYREGLDGEWRTGRVTKIGPPPEYRIFMDQH